MDTDDLFISLSFLRLCKMYINKKKKHKRRIRKWGVRPINKDYIIAGYNKKFFRTIKKSDEEQFFTNTRMSPDLFDLLLVMVRDELIKPRQRIGPEEKLSITLLYLGHGCSLQSIAWSQKLGKSTIRTIVLQTCEALWRILSPLYLNDPTTSRYQDIEKDFNALWNMPNCVGAIHGKHIAIKCPPNSNYKKYCSSVLMGVCDAKYTFTSVSMGSYASQSDAGIFRLSPFGQSVISGKVPVPPKKPLKAQCQDTFPHFFVGNAAFPLKSNLMRPYPGTNLDTNKRVFNYRLSRAWRVIENCFGIMCARWRVLLTKIEMSPENVDIIVLACTVLHNFIMLNDLKKLYCPSNFMDQEAEDGSFQEGEWRRQLRSNGERPMRSISTHIRRSTEKALNLRDRLTEFFCNEGAIPYQYGF